MRPIPAPRIGDSHGLLRAIDERERVRLDEFVTDFAIEDLFPPDLENALGRTRQFVSYARAAGLVKEDRGTVELTDVGRRYVRAGDAARPFDVSPGQAEWLRRQLREKHMTDSIFHGLAIGLSLFASSPGAQVSTLDFGRALAYLGRAGWDSDSTLEIQGERHIVLLRDLGLLDEDRRLTPSGVQAKADLTLPVHMSLVDLAGQLSPAGPAAEEDEYEDAGPAAPPEPEPEPEPPPQPEPPPPPDAATVISRPSRFVGAAEIRAAARERGLRMDAGVFANLAAALAGGHVVLVGPPGSGKTALALAVAKAGVEAGRGEGAALVSGGDESLAVHVAAAARRGRWLVVDELDRADADRVLGPLSPLLEHLPVTLGGDEGELEAPADWRVVATARTAPAGRFAAIELPGHEDLAAAVEEAAAGDAVAAAAVRRLLPLRELQPLGAGPFLAAARHAAERRAAADADERTLAREACAAYLEPLLGDAARQRAADLLA